MYYVNLKIPFNKRIRFENQKKASEEIGITPETLCRILSGKVGTRKPIAYCITKYFDSNAEIKDYFIFEGE